MDFDSRDRVGAAIVIFRFNAGMLQTFGRLRLRRRATLYGRGDLRISRKTCLELSMVRSRVMSRIVASLAA
jgi:hypothetical protein